jgi:PKHD-type hydroxylase
MRLAAVTWIQSLVRDPSKRRVIAGLGGVVDALADSPSGPRLRRAQQNLLRMWAEPVTGDVSAMPQRRASTNSE